MKFIDLTGKRFERLTVLRRTEKDKHGKIQWECICECGQITVVNGENLKYGRVKSCGCLANELHIERGQTFRLKHGHNRKGKATPEYNSWRSMIARCENTKSNSYDNYGGRGIKVCPKWRSSFENFIEDMGLKPDPSYSLDRINVDGDYNKENCRWASKTDQSRNVRSSKRNLIGVKGMKVLPSGKFKMVIGVNYKSVFLGHFDSIEQAIAARKKAEERYWTEEGDV
jgi:hypothetical protein